MSLSAFNNSYKKAEIKDYEPLPAGSYQGRVINIEYKESENKIVTEFEIHVPQPDGSVKYRNMSNYLTLRSKTGQENEIALGILKGEIALMDKDWLNLDLDKQWALYAPAVKGCFVRVYVTLKEGVNKDGAPIKRNNILIKEFFSRDRNSLPMQSQPQPQASGYQSQPQQQGVFNQPGAESVASQAPF